jgi:hypothetical protein
VLAAAASARPGTDAYLPALFLAAVAGVAVDADDAAAVVVPAVVPVTDAAGVAGALAIAIAVLEVALRVRCWCECSVAGEREVASGADKDDEDTDDGREGEERGGGAETGRSDETVDCLSAVPVAMPVAAEELPVAALLVPVAVAACTLGTGAAAIDAFEPDALAHNPVAALIPDDDDEEDDNDDEDASNAAVRARRRCTHASESDIRSDTAAVTSAEDDANADDDDDDDDEGRSAEAAAVAAGLATAETRGALDAEAGPEEAKNAEKDKDGRVGKRVAECAEERAFAIRRGGAMRTPLSSLP